MNTYKLIILAFLLAISAGLDAQNITITGRVLDADTKEGIPFCDVFFEETNVGVSTDMDGYYILETSNYGDSLAVSALGYEIVKKKISDAAEQEINFSLGAAGFELVEVIVSAGENPANAIVRNIVKNKENNRAENLNAYQCEAYTKVELDLENFDKIKDRKFAKPFEFIFENVDSTSDEKPFLPAYIMETVSDVYHAKDLGKTKEIYKARRVSGIENATVNEFINSMHEDFSVYDNWVKILDKPFASPFSGMGLHYYEYYIMDSTYIEGHKAHKLKFKPKRKQENTFYGTFWVIDSTFAIQRVDMRMSDDVNINLVSRLIVFQEFGYQGENRWLPKKQKVVIDFTPTRKEKTVGMIGRKTISFKDYRIDQEEIVDYYQTKEQTDIFSEKLEKDDSFWNDARHEKLSENEKKIYQMVDSIQNVPIYKTYVQVVQTVFSGYAEWGPVEFGPYFSVYSFDHVQGHRLRFGARTSRNLSKKFRVGGYAAYGFKDKRFKYGGDVKWLVNKSPRVFLEAAYYDDVNYSSESTEDFVTANLLSGIYRRPIYLKLLHTQEGKVAVEKYWKKGWSNRLTLLHRRMDPYGFTHPNGGGFNYAYFPNPEISSAVDTTIATTEVIFKVRYAFGEKYLDGRFTRTSLGSKYPIIELQYTQGIKGLLKSQYNYQKLTLGMRHYFYMNPIGWTSYRLKVGKTFGQVPYLLAEVHPGNETFFFDPGAFNGMNKYEFASDFYGSLMVDHHFDGFILNKIPGIRKLNWRTVTTFRAVWGSMTEQNYKANQPNLFDLSGDGKTTYTGFRVPDRVPYMEVGVGIENIFKLVRVDAMWRLNYLDNPDAKAFTFRVGVDFNF